MGLWALSISQQVRLRKYKYLKMYIGTSSVVTVSAPGSYIHMKPRVDPLGSGNILGMISGLLNASGISMTGRSMAVGKSPLTGGWGGIPTQAVGLGQN